MRTSQNIFAVRYRRVPFIAAGILAAFATIAAQANPIMVNGSFEADDWTSPSGFHEYLGTSGGQVTGWALSGVLGSEPAGVNNISTFGPAPDGQQFIALGGYTTGGVTLSQTISGFQAGSSYTLHFSISSEYFYGQVPMTASLVGASGTTEESYNAPSAFGYLWDRWTTIDLPFVATDAIETIQFTDLGSVGGIALGLDNVSVSVPDGGSVLIPFATVALLIITIRSIRSKISLEK